MLNPISQNLKCQVSGWMAALLWSLEGPWAGAWNGARPRSRRRGHRFGRAHKHELEEAAEQVQAVGRQSLVLPADVSDVSAVQAMVDAAADHFGRLDILVNAAGINIRQPVDSFTEADWID